MADARADGASPAATRLFAVITAAMLLLAGWEMFRAARHPIVMDVVGRSLRLGAIALAQGKPLYSLPALAMPYTPGYLLANAALIRLNGFSFGQWSAVWVAIDLAFLGWFTFWIGRRAPHLAPFVVMPLLACRFPFLYGRADMLALGLLAAGIVALDGPITRRRWVLAALCFALCLFVKQTLLPAIAAVAVIAFNPGLPSEAGLRRGALLLGLAVALCGAMIALYLFAWHDDAGAFAAVLTRSRDHALRPIAVMRYAGMALSLALPVTLYARWRGLPWPPILTLHVALLAYVIFSAKAGGFWHHYLALMPPWLWLLSRPAPPLVGMRATWARHAWLAAALVFLLAALYQPYRPWPGAPEDVAAMEELRDLPSIAAPVLFLDSREGFAFPEPTAARGADVPYDRGAWEEIGAAEGQAPQRLLEAVGRGYFGRICMRAGGPLAFNSYGLSYDTLYRTIETGYEPCPDIRLAHWRVWCPKP